MKNEKVGYTYIDQIQDKIEKDHQTVGFWIYVLSIIQSPN